LIIFLYESAVGKSPHARTKLMSTHWFNW